MDALVGPNGVRVEQIQVQRHLDQPPVTMLRVGHGTYFVADCRTVDEVAQHVDLATLVPSSALRSQPLPSLNGHRSAEARVAAARGGSGRRGPLG